MEPTRLNLSALRATRLPRGREAPISVPRIVQSEGAVNLSRRQLLGLAGAAAATAPPVSAAIESGLRGPLEFSGNEERAVFKLGGKERWIIDTRLFGGSPKLRFDRREGLLRLELSGATYPGTDIPADLACEVRAGAVGSRMNLRLALGDFRSSVPFERWLAGTEPARADVRIGETTCVLGGGAALVLCGGAAGEFHPDWLLRLDGAEVGVVTGLGSPLASGSVAMTLLTPEDPSILRAPSPKRTLVALARGDETWPCEEAIGEFAAGKLVASGALFDAIRIEAGEGDAGAQRALLAEAGDADAPTVAFVPHGDATGNDGEAFSLHLRSPRYAVAFDDGGNETALVAELAPDPVWLHAKGTSLQLGAPDEDGAFELVRSDGEEQFRCAPAVLTVAAPLAGAIAEPAAAEAGARVEFITDGARLAQRPTLRKPPIKLPGAPVVIPKPPGTKRKPPLVIRKPPTPVVRPRPGTITIKPGIVGIVMPAAFTLPVVRPSDLLALKFRFVNLNLETGDGRAARLVRTRADADAYVIAEFPPQHIGEQAFLETADEFDGGGGETPSAPPVGSRMSGTSRLAFRVPDETAEVPFALDALLDWTKLELSVAPTALPPPRPPAVQLAPQDRAIIGLPAAGSLMLAPARSGDVLELVPMVGAAPTPRATTTGPTARRATPTLARRAPRGITLAPTRVVAAARAPAEMVRLLKIEEPGGNQTAIEAPYRLIISPNAQAGWVHATAPVTREGRTELWHTRLGVKSAAGGVYEDQYVYAWDDGRLHVVDISGRANSYCRTIRAIWSPDYGPDSQTAPPAIEKPFRMSMNQRDRHEIVALTSDFSIRSSLNKRHTAPVQVDRLMLSSLGAWLNVRGAWAPPAPLTVQEWRHQAAMARDQYVRVVYKGYLFPFGHAASLVKVTERRFHNRRGGKVAYLRQRFFLVVREPDKHYPGPDQPNDARAMPFRHVRITTRVTPTLDALDSAESHVPGVGATVASDGDTKPQAPSSTPSAFWPRVRDAYFPFQVVAEDWDGQQCEFTIPLIFADNSIAYDATVMGQVVGHYTDASTKPRRRAETLGQKVALAESSADDPGDTTLEMDAITFGAEAPMGGASASTMEDADQPLFFPTLAWAQAHIPAVAQMTGATQAVSIQIDDTYRLGGWDDNAGEVFANLIDNVGLEFPGESSGGLVSPSLDISGLSRTFGTVGGDIADMAAGVFDVEKFFGGMAAKILGAIDLVDIIMGVFGKGKIPELTCVPEYPDDNKLAPPTAIVTKLQWTPDVKDWKPIFEKRGGCKLEMNGQLRTELAGGASTYNITTSLTKFNIGLEFIVVKFNTIKFVTKTGAKPDVDVDILDVGFGGPLEFVNKLRDFLKSGGLGGVSIDITGQGVTAGFSLQIPDVAVGVMSIQNMSVSAAIMLKFSNDPFAIRFAFCTKSDPFLITVSMFGGGGFFGIELVPTGIQLMEASFEFGGNFSLNIGVASGGAYLMAGIYLRLRARVDKPEEMEVYLEGYVRCGGHLEILKIITISCEFYLGLVYESTASGSRVWGQARLTVEIKVLFFSIGVTLKVERQFKGSSDGGHAQSLDGTRLAALDAAEALAQLPRRGSRSIADAPPPTFADLMSRVDWQEYCEAFA